MKYTKKRTEKIWILLAFIMALLSACGGRSDSEEEEGIPEQGRNFSAEFFTIEEEGTAYNSMELRGGKLFFLASDEEGSQSLCGYSLKDGSVTHRPLLWKEEEGGYLRNVTFTEDGALYGVFYRSEEEGTDLNRNRYRLFLVKFDPVGKEVFSQELTERLQGNEDGGMSVTPATDSQGRVYLWGRDRILLYEADGTYQGSLSVGESNRINAMGCDREGNMYASRHPEGITENCTLLKIEFEGQKVLEIASDFPYSAGKAFGPGLEKDFLIFDEQSVYEYDLDAGKKELLFAWADCSLGGSMAECIGIAEDGRLLAVFYDLEGVSSGVALLGRTDKRTDKSTDKSTSDSTEDNMADKADSGGADEEVTIVIGTVDDDYQLRSVADKFNMSSTGIRVIVKKYEDETELNLDIASDNCPDIISFSNLRAGYLLKKGMFEDMNGYLDKSILLDRADFFEGVLEAHTYDGILAALPRSVMISTIVGRTSEVGEKTGCTLEELMAFADAHPEAKLFCENGNFLMQDLMRYNEELFVDWEKESCSFDSEAFVELLEFVKRNSEEGFKTADEVTEGIRKGEVLLYEGLLTFHEIQVYEEIFGGEITFVGYPTASGSAGMWIGWSEAYGITVKSGHKDEAWEFLEFLFTKSDSYSAIFPALKSGLEPMILDARKIDHDGIVYGDRIGEIGGMPYTYRAVTQEEVDRVIGMIDLVEPLSAECDLQIQRIISEEAEAFYKDQKTAREVAGIIQGRVQIYISENGKYK